MDHGQSSARHESDKPSLGRAWRVLIVDDEVEIREFVERALRQAGYHTAVAADGPEALALASTQESFDLLVTDLRMPAMTGDELARRMHLHEPDLKVLYLTGYADRLFKEKMVLWEDEAFLDKPCSVKGLLQAVSLLVFGKLDGQPSPAA